MGKKLLVTIMVITFWIGSTTAQEASQATEPEKTEQQAPPAAVIELKEIEPFTYCALEMVGSYEQHEVAFDSLFQATSAQNLPAEEIPFGVYWNNPQNTPEEQLKWELGFTLTESKEVKAPLTLKKWEFKQNVTRKYDGAFNSPEIGKVYGEMFEWINKNEFVPAGPMLERYLNIPEQNEAGQWSGEVEIWIPVTKAK